MRHAVKFGILLCVMLAVTACGFHLRGSQKSVHQLKTFAIQPNTPTEYFQRIFRRYLRGIDVEISPAAANMYVVRLQPEHYVREVLVIGTDALAKQESMIYTIHFEILPPNGESLGPQSVQVTRMLNLDPSQILGQNQEETIMLHEMREEAAQQIYYRLNVIAERNKQTVPSSKTEEAALGKDMKEEEVTQKTDDPNTQDEMELVE